MARKTAKKASAKKATKAPPSKISRAEYDKRINDFIRLGQLKDAQDQQSPKAP
jgi:hypothetical protein